MRGPLVRLMDKILHDPKDPKLWELWYIPYNGSCRILSMSRIIGDVMMTTTMTMTAYGHDSKCFPIPIPFVMTSSRTYCTVLQRESFERCFSPQYGKKVLRGMLERGLD